MLALPTISIASALLLFLINGIHPVQSRESVLRPRSDGDLCAVVSPSTAIVGGKLFFSGGQYSFTGSDILAPGSRAQVSDLFSVDLNGSFPAGGYLLNSNFSSIALPSGVPYSDDNQLFFFDNSTLYFYDPGAYLNQTEDGIWAYNVVNETFTYVNVSGVTNIPYAPYEGAFASNPATGMSYYTGVQNKGLKKRDAAVPWVQVFDSSTSDVKWLAGAGGGPQFSEGEMVYVRSGKEGVLIAFGGVDPTAHGQFSQPSLGNYRDMSKIFVFDIASSTWYNVTATGDIPGGRISFCAGVSSAPDDSSFQITIYAGFTLSAGRPYNDVYVLTIPAFEWINVTPTDSTFGSGGYGRHEASCAMWNDAQMIVLGGVVANTTSGTTAINNAGCNSAAPPLLVLNTATYQWQSSFNPTLVYSQPRQVYSAIGGSSSGGSTMKAPSAGFNHPELSAIFSQTVARVAQPTTFTSATNSTSSTTTSPTATSSTTPSTGSKDKTPIAPIVGGVVGGVAGLIIIIALAVVFFRRHNRSKQQTQTGVIPTSTGVFPKSELHGESAPSAAELQAPMAESRHEMPTGNIRPMSELPAGYGGVHR